MSEKIQITKNAQQELSQKKAQLEAILSGSQSKQGNIALMQDTEKELSDLTVFLDKTEVVEFSEKQPAVVLIGARVTLENLRTNDCREYTIMTRSTANPLKGVISDESPLAQKILGLKLGNTFKFKDMANTEETYKVKQIEI